MKEQLLKLKEAALEEIKAVSAIDELDSIKVKYSGKKGELTQVLKGMKDVAPEDRPKVGQWVNDTRSAIETILEAVKKAGYEPGKDFKIAMDAASSEWKTGKVGEYKLPKAGTVYTSEELIAHWKRLVEKDPIISIEDGLDEEDWESWKKLTAELGDKVQLVGDDLFVTNTERLAKGIELGCGNSILIKLNQIGSVSETLEAIKMAHKAGYTAISSHRSGETEDTTIADLAVALNTCQIKTGAPSRTERVAKYNQLLRIEEELGAAAVYPGMGAFNVQK